MAVIEILLPKMGESVAEATITNLMVDAGSSVEADNAIVEIATDKVDSEVPAPEDGILVEWLIAEGDVVPVGAPIATFQVGGDAAEASATETASAAAPAPASPTQEVVELVSAPLNTTPNRNGPSGRFYSPLVRSIASAEGISMDELEAISGTGSEGRVTKKDILAYVENRGSASVTTSTAPAPAAAAMPAAPALNIAASSNASHPSFQSISGGYDIVEMDRMRKLIAKHMVDSVHTSPHVTSFVEADVTAMVQWRNKNKNAFQQKYGEKLTFTPLIAEAIIKAIGDFPGVNASVDGDQIVIHKAIHLGMAAALPNGNLIVPVYSTSGELRSLQSIDKKGNKRFKSASEIILSSLDYFQCLFEIS